MGEVVLSPGHCRAESLRRLPGRPAATPRCLPDRADPRPESIRRHHRPRGPVGLLGLPTIRHLAADLGLAVNTVGRAYRELEEAGLIETRRRAGSFVSAAGEEGRERARRAAADSVVSRPCRLGRQEARGYVSRVSGPAMSSGPP
ncbi:GntR family transcriptional regulator [Streptosporangium subroseum]|uniref:GntR family transcriptional regulator n=1 Tax=Streptosporangium subroseum TaxID=106412 RepID=UPI003F4DB2AB